MFKIFRKKPKKPVVVIDLAMMSEHDRGDFLRFPWFEVEEKNRIVEIIDLRCKNK